LSERENGSEGENRLLNLQSRVVTLTRAIIARGDITPGVGGNDLGDEIERETGTVTIVIDIGGTTVERNERSPQSTTGHMFLIKGTIIYRDIFAIFTGSTT
jgi:hypothetical protein